MNTPKDGGPAFPSRFAEYVGEEVSHGMTLRDWFAGMAMPGLFASPRTLNQKHDINELDIAKMAYATADAMLAERSK